VEPLTPSVLADQLKPYIVRWIQDAQLRVSGGSSGATSTVAQHEIGGTLHTGTLRNEQAPQFLLSDGTRALTGALTVAAGVTVDGVDISAHATDPDAHHARLHSILSISDHNVTGTQYQIVGLTALNTLGLLTPASSPGANQIVMTDGTNRVSLINLTVTSAILANGGVDYGTDIISEDGTYLNVTGSKPVYFSQTVQSTAWSVTTAGTATFGTRTRTPIVDTATGNLTLSPAADVILAPVSGIVRMGSGDLLQSAGFASGFTGNGWRIDEGVSVPSQTTAEVDNLTVRGLFRVYEILISKIRTGNGSYLFSDGGKVASVSGSGPYTLTFDEDHGFAVNDLLIAQKFTGTGTYQSRLTVATVPTTKTITATLYSGTAPAAGFEYVRIGSTSDTARRGTVYVTSNDSGAPYLDVVDGIAAHTDWGAAGKVRVRLGKLTGITGQANTYGLFAGDSAGTWVGMEATNGFRVMRGSVARLQADASGNLYINNSSGGNVITLDSTGGSYFSGVMTIGTSGEIRQGTGTLGTDFTGLRIWRSGSVGMIAGYNGNTQQWYANTDGKLYAGGGNVVLDTAGVSFASSADEYADPAQSLRWSLPGGEVAKVFMRSGAGVNSAGLVIQIPKTRLNVQSAIYIMEKDSPSSRLYRVWHDGNDGAGSQLDAGLVAGMYPSSPGNRWGVIPYVDASGVMEIGKYLDWHDGDAETNDNAHRTALNGGGLISYPGGAYAGSISTPTNATTYGYYEYIYNSVRSGYLIWNAQSINIYSDNNCHIIFAPNGTGKVGVNRVDPSYTLDVNGEFRATGAARLDATLSIAAVATPATSAVYSVIYVDSSDGKLKYKTTGGVVRTLSYT
jgi:hypothetical protein